MKIQRWKPSEHPIRTIVILVVGVTIFAAYMVVTAPASHAVCPLDDPCQTTSSNWQSANHMGNRFDNGNAGNAKGKTIPAGVQFMLTAKYNAKMKLPPPLPGKRFECGSHWWCNTLTASYCAVQYLMCTANNLTWGKVQQVAFRCGFASFIGGATGFLGSGLDPAGGIIGVGGGGALCTYDTIGIKEGLWPAPKAKVARR